MNINLLPCAKGYSLKIYTKGRNVIYIRELEAKLVFNLYITHENESH